jgi:hypothetical protein
VASADTGCGQGLLHEWALLQLRLRLPPASDGAVAVPRAVLESPLWADVRSSSAPSWVRPLTGAAQADGDDAPSVREFAEEVLSLVREHDLRQVLHRFPSGGGAADRDADTLLDLAGDLVFLVRLSPPAPGGCCLTRQAAGRPRRQRRRGGAPLARRRACGRGGGRPAGGRQAAAGAAGAARDRGAGAGAPCPSVCPAALTVVLRATQALQSMRSDRPQMWLLLLGRVATRCPVRLGCAALTAAVAEAAALVARCACRRARVRPRV